MEAADQWTRIPGIPKALWTIKEHVLDACGFDCSLPEAETESAEYAAYTFKINQSLIKYRVAKITPTKTGQFVTLWKRIGKGPIQPFDLSDAIHFIIISTINDPYRGLFIFPTSILLEKGILSGNKKAGKRAIRVYPPWNITASKQAQKTQEWQQPYFLEIPINKPIDLSAAKRLLTAH